jgi:hypothetical protein
MSEYIVAAARAPRGEPANIQFDLPRAIGLIWRSYPRDGIMQGSSRVQSVSRAAPALLQCTVGCSC